MKKCPFCSEEIQDEAIKCKHCGSNLQGGNNQNPAPIVIKKKTSGCAWLGLVLILIIFVLVGYNASKETKNKTDNQTQTVQPQLTQEQQDKIKADQEKADAEWKKTKAGQICSKHLEWTKDDCRNLADKKIWVGMTYDMLVFLYGNPNSINPSNYGGKTKYQYCWNNYHPSCFYDENDDKIIDAYN